MRCADHSGIRTAGGRDKGYQYGTWQQGQYDEQLVRRLIEKVTVYEERFEVKFKSGASVSVEK